MSLIQVKFDHTLQQSDIVIALTNSSQPEAGEAYQINQQEIQQTNIYGIQAPLIKINNIVVDFADVMSFELKCDKVTPEVTMTIQDRCNLTSVVDTPGIDNELRVQILPKFENKYKKINLTFYITQSKITNGIIHLTGEYKLDKYTSSNIKSFGEVSTYKLFETIAQETGLGFASNIEDNPEATRFVYCDNKSYKDLLREEITRSCTETQICDYWIDWWNNLVLADIYERYNATDPDEDMQIWISGQNKEIAQGAEIQPISVVATLMHHPAQTNNELYVQKYKICNTPSSQMYGGTDRVFSVYDLQKMEYTDFLVQDGDVKKDVFTKYEYLGEVYGNSNYLLSSKKYDTFKQKIASNETVEIELKTPLLGIMRGNRINFMWYHNDDFSSNVQKKSQEAGYVNSEPETNIQMDGTMVEENQNGQFVLDKSISGQYLVTKCNLKYKDRQWMYVVTISRPTIMKPQIINEITNE